MFLIIFTFAKKNRPINSFRIAKNIALEIATLQDIEGVLSLQELYLVSNLTEEEKEFDFVTTPFTIVQLTEVIENKGLFIAKDNHNVIAYIFAESWTFFNQWLIFNYMSSLFSKS